ncbi:WD40 repeat domain-containing protein [Ferruginibacter sp. SUN002]|uniref:WD40 repeat domain-containing protein n=1 Tax=Ferruginibacter sp. SUN002 TaxID=2937789 RepID=UPI003D35BD8E
MKKISLLLFSMFIVVVAYCQLQLKENYSTSTNHFANDLNFSKDNNYLVVVIGFSADVYKKSDNGFALLQSLPGCSGQAIHAGISEDGSLVAFGAFDRITCIHQREGDRYSLLQKLPSSKSSGYGEDLIMRFTGNDKLMIVGSDGTIRFYEREDKEFSLVKTIQNKGGLEFGKAALSPNGKLLATIDANGNLYCWDITASDAVRGAASLKSNRYVGKLDIADNYLLAAACEDSLSVYKVSKGLDAINTFCKFPTDKYSTLAFNPTGDFIVTGNKKDQLEFFKIVKNGEPVSQNIVSDATLNYDFTSCHFSPNGKWVAATSSGARRLKIFSVEGGPKGAQVKGKPMDKPVAKHTKSGADAKGTKPEKIVKSTKPIVYAKNSKSYAFPSAVKKGSRKMSFLSRPAANGTAKQYFFRTFDSTAKNKFKVIDSIVDLSVKGKALLKIFAYEYTITDTAVFSQCLYNSFGDCLYPEKEILFKMPKAGETASWVVTKGYSRSNLTAQFISGTNADTLFVEEKGAGNFVKRLYYVPPMGLVREEEGFSNIAPGKGGIVVSFLADPEVTAKWVQAAGSVSKLTFDTETNRITNELPNSKRTNKTAPAKQPVNDKVEQSEIDKKSKEVHSIYTLQDAVHRPKIKMLLKYLEGSMKMDSKGNFNRSSWSYYSTQIKDVYCKELFENIKTYKKQLESLSLAKGENELNDKLLTYLSSANTFVTSCGVWADAISEIDASDNTISTMLEILETNSNKMVKDDNDVLTFIKQYKNRNNL